MTHEERIRGERARQILEDEVLREALSAMKAEIDEALLSPSAADPDQAVRLVLRAQALRDFTDKLNHFVARGTEAPAGRASIA